MPRYEVYATRWDDPHIVEELIPAHGLQFSLPLSEHGDASFSATVEPGKSFWRASIAPNVSGILICRDDVPVWSGIVWGERQSGARTFDFQCAEWGSFFEKVPAVAKSYVQQNDQAIFRDLIDQAQAIAGQNAMVQTGSGLGSMVSDLTINPWDDVTVERTFRQLADAENGPEWYFNTAGTLDNPKRVLVLGDRLGRTDPQAVLEYVEDTGDASQSRRGGGNVIAQPARQRDGTGSATATIAIGAGEQLAQLRKFAQSDSLLAAGYPRLTSTTSYSDVTVQTTLQRHANADLAAKAGLVTGYTLSTLDDEPDWTELQRGDTVRLELDTDVYGAERPVVETPRVQKITVKVNDDGPAQVDWTVATVLEV